MRLLRLRALQEILYSIGTGDNDQPREPVVEQFRRVVWLSLLDENAARRMTAINCAVSCIAGPLCLKSSAAGGRIFIDDMVFGHAI